MQIKRAKRFLLCFFMLTLLFLLTACAQKTADDYAQHLSDVLAKQGYACTWETMTFDVRDVPIFNGEVWYRFSVNGEELLVYFDSSNRAKQLAEQFIDTREYDHVMAYGLRYIIVYQGMDIDILALLDTLAVSKPY